IPFVVGTCARNMEPNLPAPIRTTRTGLPASTRAARREARFIRLLRRYANTPGLLDKYVIPEGPDWSKVPMRDVFGARGRADVVRDGIQCQIHNLSRIGRDIARRAMYQIAMEHQHSARFARRSDDAAILNEPRYSLIVQRPKRIGRRLN